MDSEEAYRLQPNLEIHANLTVYSVDLAVEVEILDLLQVASEALEEVGEGLGDAPSQMHPVRSWVPKAVSVESRTCYQHHLEERIPLSAAAPFRDVSSSVLNLEPA